MTARDANRLPTDVYLSFVSSLFGNRGTLITGVIVHVIWCSIVYSYTGSEFYLYAAAGFAVVFALRFYEFLRFDKVDKRPLTDAQIARWEHRYVAGATLTALLLGTTSGHAMLVLKDSFVAFTCVAMTMGSMMSIVGRNYGSRFAVDFQTLGCCVPIILACVSSGDQYLALMSLLLVPFGLTTRSMANGVREFLYENVLAERKIRLIANQFDLALTTMAHGLVMLDSDGRIEVINRRGCDLLGLPSASSIDGQPLINVLRRRFKGHIEGVHQIEQLVVGELDRTILDLGDGRHIECSASRRDDDGVVLILEDVSERVAAEIKMLRMVQLDALTGLPNRAHFKALAKARLEACPPGALAAMVILDIEGFKHVNDLRGHVVGDNLLCAVASRLLLCHEKELLAGRLVGNEFVTLATAMDREQLEAQVEQLLQKMQHVYEFCEIKMSVAFNSGCVIAPVDEFDMEQWHIRSDLALNDAKAKGNGTLVFFQPEMDARYIEEQKLKQDLRRAVDERALRVVYQPMYSADGAKIECMEALVRWDHPEKGMIAPNVFIPMAEDMGIIAGISQFVLERACRECSLWEQPVAVSVNLSVHDLMSPSIVSDVFEILARTNLPPTRLHLEVTENCFIDDPVAVGGILQQLRSRGVTISIDDFGTGFSSLSYLTTLPLDIVKVDRAFVRDLNVDPRRIKLLRGITQLSRDLGLRIVIEGVETHDQLRLINENRFADIIQGYVFSAAVEAEIAVQMLQNSDKISVLKTSRKRSEPAS